MRRLVTILIGTVLVLSVIQIVLTKPAQASAIAGIGESLGLDPAWNWRTIETEHFRLTFPEELEAVANRSANLLEEAHSLLVPKLLWEPMSRTQILVIDNTDMANGLTAPVLRLGIILMVTPPEDWFSTSYYDDWLRLLIIHEYTHFLNMDVTRGFWAFTRYLFGDIFLPNSILHPWMLEGLAVYMETRLTRAGRGRSPYYDMLMRAASDMPLHIDQLNNYPYFPGGETRYLHGYQLMNRLASDVKPGPTADHEGFLQGNDQALGVLSWRSGNRFPFFINGNLENVFGKNWYQVWDELRLQAHGRIARDLDKIRSAPVSAHERLTEGNFQTFGAAISPDGHWLAYTADSLERRMGLFLRDLKSGEVRRLDDKLEGTALSFSSDSSTVFLSTLGRISNFEFYYDLYAYSLAENKMYPLTHGLRARDPSVSRDGRWIVFTLTQDAITGLAIAPLLRRGERFELGPVERVYMPERYDRVANPVFLGPDGSSIAFSFHKNGKPSQEILRYERRDAKITVLVENGRFNRQPAVSARGELFFISDFSGVDNLYRYRSGAPAQLVSNVTTGLAFPSFSPADNADPAEYYSAYFAGSGWDLARSRLLEPIPVEKVTISAPPAPNSEAPVKPAPELKLSSSEYSVWPSILPRQWAPILGFDTNRAIVGGQVTGFDAVDRHRYLVLFSYDSLYRRPDWIALYTNRVFWPTISISAENTTTGLNGATDYSRRARLELELSRAWLMTYSSLGAALGFRVDRSLVYDATVANKDEFLFSKPYEPSADLTLDFNRTESSRLAIIPEGGQRVQLAARHYFDEQVPSWKGLFIARQYLRLTEHSVVMPKVKSLWVSRLNFQYLPANSIAEGSLSSLTQPHAADSLDQLGIRGYPLTSFYARNANVFSLDYYFPLHRIFRGIGTAPVFFENLYGFVFAENTLLLTEMMGARTLPSAGGGLKLKTKLFFEAPIEMTLEYDYGFRTQYRGSGELFAVISADALSF